MSQPKEIYRTTNSDGSFQFVDKPHEYLHDMNLVVKYHHDDVVEELKAEFILLSDSFSAYQKSVPFGGADSAQEQYRGAVEQSIDDIHDIFEALK